MMPHKEDGFGVAMLGLGIGAAALFGALAAVTTQIGPASIPIWFSAVLMLFLFSRSPLAKALAERISGKSNDQQLLPDQVFGELDELRQRLGEMEERLDFAERLLARPATAEGAMRNSPLGTSAHEGAR